MNKKTYIKIAEEWLESHYPKEGDEIDTKWSAVLNFARFLDKRN